MQGRKPKVERLHPGPVVIEGQRQYGENLQ